MNWLQPRHARLSLFALLAGLAALGGVASRAQAAFPGANGKIAFHTDRDGNNEIYTVPTDAGSTPPSTRLTNNPASDVQPAWSPDGTKIAFATNRDGNNEIYTMNADGTSPTRLTNNTASDVAPAWSADGTKIAFVTNRDGNNEIYAMNADGSGQTNLTNSTFGDSFAAWSPDGTKIAFATDRDGNNEIYTMNADGTSPTRLTNNTASDVEPAWSPDATRIAFASNRASDYDIWTMNPDGTSLGAISFSAFDERKPAWSPDGTGTAFTTRVGGDEEIFANQYLTSNTATDTWPDWQPVLRSYARPKGATPLRVPLTPAYKQCTAPNTTHQAPLSFPSCNPPTPTSSFLTVGTPDFNGQAANSIGSVVFRAKVTTPVDGLIDVSLTDVRCQGTSSGCGGGALSDYTGDLRLETSFRITDKANGGANPSGTLTDLPLSVRVPCAPTISTTVGSTCAVSTTKNTVVGPSAIVAGKRAIWQLSGELKLYDGGPTGLSTDPNATLFAVGGLFYP